MIIEPRIRGFICMTAHPDGCAAHVAEQIDYVRRRDPVRRPPPGAGDRRLHRLRARLAHRGRLRLRRRYSWRVLRAAGGPAPHRLGRLVQQRRLRTRRQCRRPRRLEHQRRRLLQRGAAADPGLGGRAPGPGRPGGLQPGVAAPYPPRLGRDLQQRAQADRANATPAPPSIPRTAQSAKVRIETGPRGRDRCYGGGDGRRRLAALERCAARRRVAGAGLSQRGLHLRRAFLYPRHLPRRNDRAAPRSTWSGPRAPSTKSCRRVP